MQKLFFFILISVGSIYAQEFTMDVDLHFSNAKQEAWQRYDIYSYKDFRKQCLRESNPMNDHRYLRMYFDGQTIGNVTVIEKNFKSRRNVCNAAQSLLAAVTFNKDYKLSLKKYVLHGFAYFKGEAIIGIFAEGDTEEALLDSCKALIHPRGYLTVMVDKVYAQVNSGKRMNDSFRRRMTLHEICEEAIDIAL